MDPSAAEVRNAAAHALQQERDGALPDVLELDHGYASLPKLTPQKEHPDYLYGLLNVSRTATEEEIRTSYKKLCKVFHPDKFKTEEERAKAAVWFKAVQEAHAILTDPRKRRVYDTVGIRGLEDRWLVQYDATADQIRMSYQTFLLQKKYFPPSLPLDICFLLSYCASPEMWCIVSQSVYRRAKEQQRFQVRSRVGISEEGGGGPSWDQGIAMEVSRQLVSGFEVSSAQRRAQLTLAVRPSRAAAPHSNLTLSGFWMRYERGRAATPVPFAELRSSLVRRSSGMGWGLDVAIASLLGRSAWFILDADKPITPSVSALLSTSFGAANEVKASLRWQSVREQKKRAQETEEEVEGRRSSAEVGCHLRQETPDMFLKLRRALSKRGEAEFQATWSVGGSWGLQLSFGVRRYVSSQAALGISLAYSNSIITISPSILVNSHEILIPIPIAAPSIALRLGIPLACFVAVRLLKFFVLVPLKRHAKRESIKKLQRKSRRATEEAKKRAEEAVGLMKESVELKRTREEAAGGLLIVEAIYSRVPASTAHEKVDVTVALQYQVEAGVLHLPSSVSKANLPGFWDPALGDAKQLSIKYLYRNRLHSITVWDDDELSLPLPADLTSS